jgi:asparagine synthase (glutamine-hydrolysing)
MSAIWGIIHLDYREVDNNLGVMMEKSMKQYKLDRCLTVKKSNAVFGCGIQYITMEAVNEQLPLYDTDNLLFYTADCILDNREELMDKLVGKDITIPDGALLYQAYLKWGEKFTEYVLGAFSLVIYDERKNTCILFTDHTGSRSLYYCLVDNTIYFASIFTPLLAVLPKEARKINEKWMVACALSVTPVMEYIPELTPFEKISQVLAGHYITAHLEEANAIIYKKRYWGLEQRKKIKFKTQEEYRELFIKTLSECVRSVMRSSENTGITLSSGLDSSSVACVAAKLLEGRNKKLFSFTSIPVADYKENQNPYFIVDESEGVKCICEAYLNIDAEFVRCDGKNVCTELERMVRYLEFPHKSRQNMVWIDEIYERAALKGCKVVLKGQYGNATISQGKILSRVYDDICHFRFKSAFREMNLFCLKNNISRKKAIKIFVNEMKKRIWYPQEEFKDTTVRKDLIDKHNIIKLVNDTCKTAGSDMLHVERQRIGFMYDMSALIQLGALDTRFGLYHGIVIRDPLKDKRMIELCASYPIKCFVQDGVERAAVRKYMRGIIPDTILNIVNRRGLQSADYIIRLRTNWDWTKQAMLKILEQPQLLNYIDNQNMEQILEEVKNDEILNQEDHLMKALMLCSSATFLKYFNV